MSIKVFFSAFNIDDTKWKWGVRALFLVLSVLMVFAILFPLGDPDIDKVLSIYKKSLENPYAQFTNEDIKDILMCMLYVISIEVYNYLISLISVITAAVFIYNRRPVKTPELKKKVKKNTILACLFLALIFTVLQSFHDTFYIIYAFFLSYISMIGCCFISGDNGFGRSFKGGFSFMKKNAPMCLVNFILMFLIFYFADFIISLLSEGNAYTTIVGALAGPLTIYKALVFGRMTGTLYLNGQK